MSDVTWKIGVELELMAPPGASRRTLAERIAEHIGGTVRPFFLPQSEPSKVPGKPIFHNLTLGFEVCDANDVLVAKCVDDLTLQSDFDRTATPRPGWYRIVGDDPRLLRLIARLARAELPLPEALGPVAELFETEPTEGEGGMFRIADEVGAPICIGAPLPGERERPCELITAPLERDHRERLTELLDHAHALKFTLPNESATHIHFDAEPLKRPRTIANLVHLLSGHNRGLKRLLQTNPANRRLGSWSKPLFELVRRRDFLEETDWTVAREQLAQLKLSKYRDFNLKNIAHGFRDRHTFEVRILPGYLEVEPIIEAAALFEAILRQASEPDRAQRPLPPQPWAKTRQWLKSLPLEEPMRTRWSKRSAKA